MITYQFDEDYGARENLSILYNDVLVVVADPAAQQQQVDAIVESFISYDPSDGSFDPDFDRPALAQKLTQAGFPAEVLTPNIYINED